MDLLLVGTCLLVYPVLLAVCYYLITLLHELGHALAALTATTGPVTVYVGSYGPAEASWQLPLGRLRLYLHPKLRLWRSGGGYCQHEPVASTWQNILILLAGPVLPLLVSGLAFYVSLQHPNGWWRLPLFLVAFLAFWSMLASLVRGGQVSLADGRMVESDGVQIRQYLRDHRLHRLAEQAQQLAEAGRYAECASLYAALAQQLPPASWLLRNLLRSYWLSGQLEAALASSQRLEQELPQDFADDDLLTRGNLLAWQGQYTAALAIYEQLLARPAPHTSAYNNRDYTHNLLGNYAAAVADFDQAIALEASTAYAHSNRGLAYLRLGREADGLADIAHGLQLDPANAYGYRNLGIYHLDRSEYAAALAQFEQASQLDPHTHDLAHYLQQTRQQLENTSAAGGQGMVA